jgi:hypothetical protein
MFADTLTIAFNGSDRVLTRVNFDNFTSQYRYRATNLTIDMAIRHNERLEKGKSVKTDRHNVEFILTTYTDVDGVLTPKTHKAFFVIELPASDGAAEVLDMSAALIAMLSDANVTKLVNWES